MLYVVDTPGCCGRCGASYDTAATVWIGCVVVVARSESSGDLLDYGVGRRSVCRLLSLHACPHEVTGNGANERLDVAWTGHRSRRDVCRRWVDGAVEAQAGDHGRIVVWFSEVFVVCDECVEPVIGWGDVAWFSVHLRLHIYADLLGAASRCGLENSRSSFVEFDGGWGRKLDWIFGDGKLALLVSRPSG